MLRSADFVLAELERDRFPNLVKFLKNARFDSYQIADAKAFEGESVEPEVEKLIGEQFMFAKTKSGPQGVSAPSGPRFLPSFQIWQCQKKRKLLFDDYFSFSISASDNS